MVVTIDLNMCEFNKDRKTLIAYMGQFPDAIEVISHHTGKVVRFVPDTQAAMENEGWDGEECHYIPVERTPNVDTLVVLPEH